MAGNYAVTDILCLVPGKFLHHIASGQQKNSDKPGEKSQKRPRLKPHRLLPTASSFETMRTMALKWPRHGYAGMAAPSSQSLWPTGFCFLMNRCRCCCKVLVVSSTDIRTVWLFIMYIKTEREDRFHLGVCQRMNLSESLLFKSYATKKGQVASIYRTEHRLPLKTKRLSCTSYWRLSCLSYFCEMVKLSLAWTKSDMFTRCTSFLVLVCVVLNSLLCYVTAKQYFLLNL